MGDSSLPGSLKQSLALSNLYSVGMQSSILSNLALGNLIQNVNQAQQNSVSIQQLMNQLQMTVMGKMVDRLTRTDPAAVRLARQMREREVLQLLVILLKRHQQR